MAMNFGQPGGGQGRDTGAVQAAKPVEAAQPVAAPASTAMVPAGAGGALATQRDAVPLVYGGIDLTFDPFALMDMNDADSQLGQMPPLRRIEYCASDDSTGLQAGWITDTLTRTQKQRIDAVLVAVKFTRLCMGKFNPSAPKDGASRRPICASSTGKQRTGGTGAGIVTVGVKDGSERDMQVTVPEGQNCATCPWAKWPDNQKRPVCSEAYNLLMADLEDGGTPFMVNIWHTGIKPLKVFRNALKASALKVWTPADGVPPNMRVRFEFSATPEKRYYLPTFTNLTDLSLEEARRLAMGLAPIIEAFNSQDTTEVATQDVISEDDLEAQGSAAEPDFGGHEAPMPVGRQTPPPPVQTSAPQAAPSPAAPPPGSSVGQFGRRAKAAS